MTDYLYCSAKYEPTRGHRIRRTIPSLTVRYSRRERVWTARRRWRNGSVCTATAFKLRDAIRFARRGGATLYLPVDGGDIDPGHVYTHICSTRRPR